MHLRMNNFETHGSFKLCAYVPLHISCLSRSLAQQGNLYIPMVGVNNFSPAIKATHVNAILILEMKYE